MLKVALDQLDAAAQLAINALPDKVSGALNQGIQDVNDLPVVGSVTKALKQREATYQAVCQATGQSGTDWARLSGNNIRYELSVKNKEEVNRNFYLNSKIW
jgi:hypothetical protein